MQDFNATAVIDATQNCAEQLSRFFPHVIAASRAGPSHRRCARQIATTRGHGSRIRRHGARDFFINAAAGVCGSRESGKCAKCERDGSQRRRSAVSRRTKGRGSAISARTVRLGETNAMKMTTLNLSGPPRSETAPRQAQWDEARSVFPIYLSDRQTAGDRCSLSARQAQPGGKSRPGTIQPSANMAGFHGSARAAHELRHLLQMTTLNASESGLSSLIQRHMRKPTKNNVDRDKIDFLLVQYFALCAPAKIYHKQIELADVATVMKPVLGDASATTLSWCEPLEKMIEPCETSALCAPSPNRNSCARPQG